MGLDNCMSLQLNKRSKYFIYINIILYLLLMSGLLYYAITTDKNAILNKMNIILVFLITYAVLLSIISAKVIRDSLDGIYEAFLISCLAPFVVAMENYFGICSDTRSFNIPWFAYILIFTLVFISLVIGILILEIYESKHTSIKEYQN